MTNVNLSVMSKDNEIFNYLHSAGCCKRCCLRYIFVRGPNKYTDVDSYIRERKFHEEITDSDEQIAKKRKANPCIVCLGLLQDDLVDEIVEKIGVDEKILGYDSSVFTCSISYPACIQVREHSIKLYLDKKYKDYFTEDQMETPINKVWKWIIKDKIEAKLGKMFESSESCQFSINVSLTYELDEQELKVLLKMQPELFNLRKSQHRKYNNGIFTRKGVLNALEQTRDGVFIECAAVPPETPTKRLEFHGIECSHDPVYLAGRYCKLSRCLSQTPWLINGVRQMESSVQDVIFDAIRAALNITESALVFSASGREDVDVRCLGDGRPFYIEIQNPKRTKFGFDEMRRAEDEINRSQTVKVKDLQSVLRSELSQIKTGEEEKTKNYIALCTIKTGVTDDMIDKINSHGRVVLQQKTPIRVMHRRPLAVRERTVLSMSAKRITGDDNLFTLMLETQAGTYVKEFVHGDFGRTVPNVSTIVGADVDISALDVLAVNLDWPKKIDYTSTP